MYVDDKGTGRVNCLIEQNNKNPELFTMSLGETYFIWKGVSLHHRCLEERLMYVPVVPVVNVCTK